MYPTRSSSRQNTIELGIIWGREIKCKSQAKNNLNLWENSFYGVDIIPTI